MTFASNCRVEPGKMTSPGLHAPSRTDSTDMTTAPKEINAAAIKNSATEKLTPMMQQYLRATFLIKI